MSCILAELSIKGNFDQGFSVTITIGIEGGPRQIRGKEGFLPASAALASCYKSWCQAYSGYQLSSHQLLPRIELLSVDCNVDDTNTARQRCVDTAEALSKELNHWLASNSFSPVRETLCSKLSGQQAARLILCTDNEILWRLPWHRWVFLENEDFPPIDVSFSPWDYQQTVYPGREGLTSPVKVLACLAESEGINIELDKKHLSKIPGIKLLDLRDRKPMVDALWKEPWDVVVFSGHSQTRGEHGSLSPGLNDSLILNEFRQTLRQAAQKGLQLVVFNSCDGIGLARQLQDIPIPHVIVMREPIPDAVAHRFIECFFDNFRAGMLLDEAVKDARGQLETLHREYPCASWLPAIWQSPATRALQWPRSVSSPSIWRNFLVLCCITLAVLVCLLGIRHFGFLQLWELSAYDRMMRLRPDSRSIDEQVIVIGIDAKDIQYQQQQGIESSSFISDKALLRLLKKINPYNPSVVGLDIWHNFPFEDELNRYLKSHENLVVMCRHQVMTRNTRLSGIAAPDNFPLYSTDGDTQIGFTNTPQDGDSVLRRQAIAQGADSYCKGNSPDERDLSFNLAITLKHLNHLKTDLVLNKQNQQEIKIGEMILPRISPNFGGYNLSEKELPNYQIMLNYRKESIKSVSLRSVLDGSSDTDLESLVSGKVVLIGRDDGKEDLYLTPHSYASYPPIKQAGIQIQAQMVSQLTNYITHNGRLSNPTRRLLLRSWAELQEYLWIGFWVTVGSGLAYLVSTFWTKLLSVVFVLAILYGICLLLLSSNFWVPVIVPMMGFIIAFLIVSVSKNRLFSRSISS